jgi:hypothetical protein
MPASDYYHDTVIRALEKDGWTIGDDDEQVVFILDKRQVVIDIQARKTDSNAIILVEVKGFRPSPLQELAIAVGKILIYRFVLRELQEDAPLWLAVPESAYDGILAERMGKTMSRTAEFNLLVFSPQEEEIVKWIPYAPS